MAAIQFLVELPKPATRPQRSTRLAAYIALEGEITLYLLDEERLRVGRAEERTHLLERFEAWSRATREWTQTDFEPVLVEFGLLVAVAKVYLAEQERAARTSTIPAPAVS